MCAYLLVSVLAFLSLEQMLEMYIKLSVCCAMSGRSHTGMSYVYVSTQGGSNTCIVPPVLIQIGEQDENLCEVRLMV